MQAHSLCVAAGQDERRALAPGWADGAINIGGGGALILGGRRPRSASGPAPGDLVLLPDTCFVLPPYLYKCALREGLFDGCYRGVEVFLKAGMASPSCAWWRGRADNLR